MARSRSRAKNNSNVKRRLCPPLPVSAKTYKISHGHKLLCQSSQEQLPVGGIASAYRQECSRVGPKSNISRVFQPAFPSPKTQQQMETNTGSEQSKLLPQCGEIQDGDTGNDQDIPPTMGVDHLSRLQRRLLPHTNTETIQEISEISCPGPDLPVQSSALWSVHDPHGVHCISERGKTDGRTQGYKDPPVPRQLVGESRIQTTLSHTYTDPDQNVSGSRLASKHGEIRTGTKASFQFCRLSIRPQVRSSQTDTGPVAKPSGQSANTLINAGLSGPAVHVPDRFINSDREASSPWPTTHETHSVASQKQLEGTGISGEDYPSTQILAPTLTMVARRKQRVARSTITPHKTCSANIYRHIKRRVGRSLRRAHCKRVLVGAGKQIVHQLSGAKSSVPSFERISRTLRRQDGVSGNRQHYSGSLHKQGRRHEVGLSMCSPVVFPETSNSKSLTHPGPSECNSRQTVPAGSDHPDRMVPPSRNFSQIVQQMAPTSDRSVCDEVQPQVTSFCVSSSRFPGCSSGCTHSAMGGSGCVCLPTDRHIGQSGGETSGLPMQETHSDCPGMAQHAMVLGLGDHVQSSPSQPSKSAQSVDTALQPDPSQKPDKPKSPCMAPRATAIKEQGFSEAVAARIEAPQRRSTRSVYEAKWAIFTKWCISNQVEFNSPPVTLVADFLL